MNRVLSLLPVLVALAGCRSEPIPEYRRWLEVEPDCWSEGTEFVPTLLPNPVRVRFQKEPLTALPATAWVEHYFLVEAEPPDDPEDEEWSSIDRTPPVQLAVSLEWHTDGDGERAWTTLEIEYPEPAQGQDFQFNAAPNDPDFAAWYCTAAPDDVHGGLVRYADCRDYWDQLWEPLSDAVYQGLAFEPDCEEEQPGDPPPP